MNKKVLAAVAWPYVNGDIHLGHLAGYLLPADVFARYKRLRGDDVLMVSGSDCHGTPITVEADKLKVTPAEVVDIYHKKDVELFKQLGLSYNLYTKTTTDIHRVVVQELFLDLLNNGYIVKDVMKQYYSEEDKKFLPDRYVEGTCSFCGATEQRSDMCEKCGRWLNEGELLNPYSKQTKAPVQLKETEHYFLDFEKLTSELKGYLSTKKDVWRNWVWSEASGWLNEGLKKRAITRDLDWGIELPISEIEKLSDDKKLENYDGKKIYVWFEAVTGYLSAPQEWVKYENADSPVGDLIYYRSNGQSNDWRDWWINNEAEQTYFMGQDNLVFHTLMWQAQLIGTKKGYTLPNNVSVNKFMNYEGKKFSKSRNWTIDSKKMVEKFGIDLVRYAISSNLPENKEADFTWEGFVDNINNELVANLGNFINRSLKFFETRFGGEIDLGESFALDEEVQAEIYKAYGESAELLERTSISEALNRIMAFSKFANQYFDKSQIWKVIKEDEAKAKVIMGNLLNIIENLRVLISPFVFEASENLAKMLEINDRKTTLNVGEDFWTAQTYNKFKVFGEIMLLFTKLEKEVVVNEKV